MPPTMVELIRKTRVIAGVSPDRIPFDELLDSGEPTILQGLAGDWPLVTRGRESADSAVAYLKRFCSPKPTNVYIGDPAIRGRFFYNEQFNGFNFTSHRMALAECLDRVMAHSGDVHAPSLYAGSTDVDIFLPGLRAENDLRLDHPMFLGDRPLVSIWIGNRTIASAHYDHVAQPGLLHGRAATLFAIPSRPDSQPLSGSAGSHAWWPGGQHR